MEMVDTKSMDLSQPELLPHTALIQILEQRYVKGRDFYKLPKYELIELFHEIIVPQPQRIYRTNRRGTHMTKLREKQEKARKEQESKAGDVDKARQTVSAKHSRIDFKSSSEPSPTKTYRLKPPPEVGNLTKKVRLNSSSSDSSDYNSKDSRTVKIGTKRKSEDSDGEKNKDVPDSPKKTKHAQISWP